MPVPYLEYAGFVSHYSKFLSYLFRGMLHLEPQFASLTHRILAAKETTGLYLAVRKFSALSTLIESLTGRNSVPVEEEAIISTSFAVLYAAWRGVLTALFPKSQSDNTTEADKAVDVVEGCRRNIRNPGRSSERSVMLPFRLASCSKAYDFGQEGCSFNEVYQICLPEK